LDQWAKTWLVYFNPKKTKALIISNTTNIPELNIRFNDESVELVDNHKHLGVTFYNESLLAHFVRPVTIRAASNCIFSNCSMSRS
jgi:hypothetical protein